MKLLMQSMRVCFKRVTVYCNKCKVAFLWDDEDRFNPHAKCPHCGATNR